MDKSTSNKIYLLNIRSLSKQWGNINKSSNAIDNMTKFIPVSYWKNIL